MRRLISCLLVPAALLFAAGSAAAFESDRITVTARGQGPDVVLIPGLSSSPEVWDSTVEALPGYRYHLVQVHGFAGVPAGGNAQADGPNPVVAPVADEIARYIAEEGLETPALVGHSMGGKLAMMVAARNPGAASKVMVVDMIPFLGGLFGGPTATPQSVEPMAAQMRAGISGGTGDARRAAIEGAINGMIKNEGLRADPLRHSLDSDPATSGQAMYDLITTDLRPELAKIDVPLTVLWVNPPGSPVTEEMMGMFYTMSYATAPQATITHIPDSWHFIMFDAPERFQQELKGFLGGK